MLGKVKVIHIITRFDKGGSAENTFLTIKYLDKERYGVILARGLSKEFDLGAQEAQAVENNLAEAKRNGVKIVTIPELVRRIHPLYDLKAFVTLIKIFREECPHIVHTHTSKAGLLGRWAAFFARIPIIVHTPHGHVFWGYFSRWKTLVFVFLEKLTAYITDKIITLTEQEKRDHLRYNIASEDKFLHVHSGVDLTKFTSRAFSMVINQVVFIRLSYNLLQLYLLRKGRKELNNETLPHIRQQLLPSDNHIIVYFENYYGLFAPLEFTEIIATLGEEARKKVAGKCRRLRRELNGVIRNPRAP